MFTYRRLVGVASLTGLLGLLLAAGAAEPPPEPVRVESGLVGEPVLSPQPAVWVQAAPVPTATAVKGSGRPTRAAAREGLIDEILPILENTKSSATFLMALESLVVLDAPPEKVIPACLRAMERLDEFKPFPKPDDDSKTPLIEGVSESIRMLLEKKVRGGKASRLSAGPFQDREAVTLPSPHYLDHPPQYFPPSPPFPLPRELAYQEKVWASPPGVPMVPSGGLMCPPCPPPTAIPEPVPTAPSVPPKPKAISEPVPVPSPTPQAAVEPIPVRLPVGAAEESSPIVPVSTLPASTRQADPSWKPGRLVPIPGVPMSPAPNDPTMR